MARPRPNRRALRDSSRWLDEAHQAYSDGRLDEAIRLHHLALESGGLEADAYNDLGVALRAKHCAAAAIVCYRRVLEIDPDRADTWSNLGNAYLDRGDFSNAVDCSRRAVELEPEDPDLAFNLGIALRHAGLAAEALAYLERALNGRPGNSRAFFERVHTLFLLGRYAEGCVGYERRFELMPADTRCFDTPVWDGGSLEGKTLLVLSEQGYGDMIQFARFIPRLLKLTDNGLELECQPKLARLLSSIHSSVRVTKKGQPLPSHAVRISMMSLPYLLGVDRHDVVVDTPYLRVQDRRIPERLVSADSQKLKVGLTWAGKMNPRDRSCPFEEFVGIADVARVEFYSLQRGDRARDIERHGCQSIITDLAVQLDDFADDAEVIERLDLVITVDTAMCHLGGALGKPTWTLLTYAAEWRFGLDQTKCDWYPTMRLFRQKTPNDWRPVVEEVRQALGCLASELKSVNQCS